MSKKDGDSKAGKDIVVVLGSPRREGNSASLAERIDAGARTVGAEVSTIFLHGLRIQPCSACAACQVSSDAGCIVDDDMQSVYTAVRRADVLVLATPIYWFSVSAQMKLFLDRCYALGGPQGSALNGKKIVIAVSYEDADPFVSGAVNALRSFQDAFAYVGAIIVGMVYGSAHKVGEIRVNEDLMKRAFDLGVRIGSAE